MRAGMGGARRGPPWVRAREGVVLGLLALLGAMGGFQRKDAHPFGPPAPSEVAGDPDGCPFDVPSELTQVGFQEEFEAKARPKNGERPAGSATWTVVHGHLSDDRVSSDGLTFRGRTPPLGDDALAQQGAIVPFSPRTQGRIELSFQWTEGRRQCRRKVVVTAASRASGVPSVAVGQRIYLNGTGWELEASPPDGDALVAERGGRWTFTAQGPGAYRLRDAFGKALEMRVGTHAGTALECGRSDCHADIADAAEKSPMAQTFKRWLEGTSAAKVDPSCGMGCHTVGEPGGGDDGGFAAVAKVLGYEVPAQPHAKAWAELPRPLRRLSGVPCTGCHGPAAIPAPSARATLLRADVCTVCHDAPPRYLHGLAWAQSAMARADAAPTVRQDDGCAACHTTAGFLRRVTGRRFAPEERNWRTGISCAACHAPHGAHEGPLLRTVRFSEAEEKALSGVDGATRLCLTCHGAGENPTGGRAPAGFLWMGPVVQGGGLPVEGSKARGPHGTLACITCHGGSPPSTAGGRGAGHSFSVDNTRCGSCHGTTQPSEVRSPEGRTLAERAEALRKTLGIAKGPARPHAETGPGRSVNTCASKVRLVAEDAAAAVHNGPWARALLEEVEQALKRNGCSEERPSP